MSWRQKIFGQRLDQSTTRGIFNYLFEKTGFDKYQYLLMRTDIHNRYVMESVFMLNVLMTGLKSKGAMIGAVILEEALISRNRLGREEALIALTGNLPHEVKIPTGKDSTNIDQ